MRIIKIVFLIVSSFLIACLGYWGYFFCNQTRSPLSDIFTTGRISVLRDRPENITKDVVVDLSNLSEKGGVLTLTTALISDIARKRSNWRLIVLVKNGYQENYCLPSCPNIKIVEIRNRAHVFKYQHIIPVILGKILHDKLSQLLYYDLIFCDKYCDLLWDPLGESSWCDFVTVPRISTIHDISCFDVGPEYFAAPKHQQMAKICTNNSIRFSKKIITVSKFSKERICNKFNVPTDFVCEIPIKLGTRVLADNDPAKRIEVMNKYKLEPQKYFIFCSSWWRNKNHGILIKAFNKFSEKTPKIKLVLVGDHPKTFQNRPIEEYSSDRLIISGFVPDDELAILLKNALAFIHPSVYEGFGMPIIEAMANGIPVACSNVASLPEVAGDAALFFDPFDINSIVDAMHKLANNPELREELIKKGYEQAKKYSNRDEMVDEYIRVMEEVMASKK